MATIEVKGHGEVPEKSTNSLMPESKTDLSALLKKLVKQEPNASNTTVPHTNAAVQYDMSALTQVAMEISNEIRDNKTIIEMLPETRAAINLMVSTIKSPQTLIGTDLIWEMPESPDGIEWSGNFAQELQDWFEDDYKIDTRIQKILWDCLAYTGSHPIMVVPESIVDDIINGKDLSNEVLAAENWENHQTLKNLPFSLKENEVINISLKPLSEVMAAESFNDAVDTEDAKLAQAICGAIKDSVVITDNLDILKKPKVMEMHRLAKRQEERESQYCGVYAQESFGSCSDLLNNRKTQFKKRKYNSNPLLQLKPKANYDRLEGAGVILELPSTSVIPVSEKGPYFVLLNGNGKPISAEETESEFRTMSNILQNNVSGEDLMNKLNTLSQNGFQLEKGTAELTIERIKRTYDNIFDKMCEDVFSGEPGAEDIHLPELSEMYQTLMFRALRGQRTTVLYVPEDLITYYCLERNNYGVGESLLSKNKFLASMRASLKLAEVLAGVNSSIPHRSAVVKIDSNDQEPLVTREVALNSLVERRLSEIPWVNGISMGRITNALVKSGTDVRVEHPNLPDTHIEISDNNRNIQRPDNDLSDRLRREWFQALDTQPELIEAAFKPEFAVEYVSKNALYTKMVINRQDQLAPLITDNVRKLSWNIPDIYRIIYDNLSVVKSVDGISKEDIVEYIIWNMNVSLPCPDGSKIDSVEEAYKKFCDFLNQAIDAYISRDMLDRMLDGEIVTDDALKAIQEQVTMLCRREWLEQHNSIPILNRLTQAMSRENELAIDFSARIKEHNKNLISNMGDIVTDIIKHYNKVDSKSEEKIEKALEKLGADDDENQVDDQTSDDSADTSLDTPAGDTAVEGEEKEDDTEVTPPEEGAEDEEPKKEEGDDEFNPDEFNFSK